MSTPPNGVIAEDDSGDTLLYTKSFGSDAKITVISDRAAAANSTASAQPAKPIWCRCRGDDRRTSFTVRVL